MTGDIGVVISNCLHDGWELPFSIRESAKYVMGDSVESKSEVNEKYLA